MKIRKVYESGNVHFNAKLLANKLSKKFFNNLDEFVTIIVNDESEHDVMGTKSFMFYICFDEIHIETVNAMEKFNKFIGRINADQWVFKTGEFTGQHYIYDFIDLYVKDIDKHLEQLEMEEDANKYNL